MFGGQWYRSWGMHPGVIVSLLKSNNHYAIQPWPQCYKQYCVVSSFCHAISPAIFLEVNILSSESSDSYSFINKIDKNSGGHLVKVAVESSFKKQRQLKGNQWKGQWTRWKKPWRCRWEGGGSCCQGDLFLLDRLIPASDLSQLNSPAVLNLAWPGVENTMASWCDCRGVELVQVRAAGGECHVNPTCDAQ